MCKDGFHANGIHYKPVNAAWIWFLVKVTLRKYKMKKKKKNYVDDDL